MKKLFLILLLTNCSFAQETSWLLHIIDGNGTGADGIRLTDLNGDKLLDVVTGWEESGITKVYLNPGASKVKEAWPSVVVGKTKSVEDAFFQDLDQDANPDVITCSEGKNKSISIHWNPGTNELLKAGSWKQDLIPCSKNLTSWMFGVSLQIDGKNGPDIIAGSKGKKKCSDRLVSNA